MPMTRTPVILLAEDDDDDFFLTRQAFEKADVAVRFRRVRDGEELLQTLLNPGGTDGLPDLILLDLNMPRRDGREALREIRSRPELRGIPVVVLTTSETPEDVRRSYQAGANSYVRKPSSFDGMIEMVRTFARFWFRTAQLPG